MQIFMEFHCIETPPPFKKGVIGTAWGLFAWAIKVNEITDSFPSFNLYILSEILFSCHFVHLLKHF